MKKSRRGGYASTNERYGNLLAKRFGRLTVVGGPEPDGKGNRRWACVCDCGGTNNVVTAELRSGHTRSCGCLVVDACLKNIRGVVKPPRHGYSNTSTYGIWKKMVARATGKASTQSARELYQHVTVCERWRRFENFLADMGERPAGLTLERKNNMLGYEPDNCKWASRAEQSANRRRRRTRAERDAALAAFAERQSNGDLVKIKTRDFGLKRRGR